MENLHLEDPVCCFRQIGHAHMEPAGTDFLIGGEHRTVARHGGIIIGDRQHDPKVFHRMDPLYAGPGDGESLAGLHLGDWGGDTGILSGHRAQRAVQHKPSGVLRGRIDGEGAARAGRYKNTDQCGSEHGAVTFYAASLHNDGPVSIVLFLSFVVKVRLHKRNMPKPLNIAHRGGAQLWPENTLFAFVSAAKAGYDGAELDVQMTRDEKLIVFHDFRLKRELCRFPDGRWLKRKRWAPLPLIRELTFAELQEFDVGRPKPGTLYARRHKNLSAHDGEHMPSLAEVIAGVRAVKPDFQLFVEIKTSLKDPALSAAPEAVAEAVLAELRRAKFLEHAVMVGFDWRGLIHAKRLEPTLRCWFSTERGARVAADSIKQAGGDGWFCSRDRARASRVRDSQALGLGFGVWTVNET